MTPLIRALTPLLHRGPVNSLFVSRRGDHLQLASTVGRWSSCGIPRHPTPIRRKPGCYAYLTDVIRRAHAVRRIGRPRPSARIGVDAPANPERAPSRADHRRKRWRRRYVADVADFRRIPISRISRNRRKLPASGALATRPSRPICLIREELSLITEKSHFGDVQISKICRGALYCLRFKS